MKELKNAKKGEMSFVPRTRIWQLLILITELKGISQRHWVLYTEVL